MSTIKNSVALVTGASSGIGFHIAEQLAAKGGTVAMVARRKEKLAEGRELILRRSPAARVLCLPGDVTSEGDRKDILDAVAAQAGPVDILVNNAGLGLCAPTWSVEMGTARRIFEVNYFAALAWAQAVLPDMIKRKRGHIVNISSYVAEKGMMYHGIYAGSKAALDRLAEALKFELKGTGVNVTTVHPGTTKTEYYSSMVVCGGVRWNVLTPGQDPAKVAQAVADAIENNRTHVTLTFSARAFSLINRLSRTLADFVFERCKGKDRVPL